MDFARKYIKSTALWQSPWAISISVLISSPIFVPTLTLLIHEDGHHMEFYLSGFCTSFKTSSAFFVTDSVKCFTQAE